MITPKPTVGTTVTFLTQVTVSWYGKKQVFDAIVEGTVIKAYPKKDRYEVEWKDEDAGKKQLLMVTITRIHSFEWGGILIYNPRRDKKLFQGVGIW